MSFIYTSYLFTKMAQKFGVVYLDPMNQPKEVEVVINADGKSCTTVNPLGECPEVGREKLYSSQDTSSKSQFYHEDWHKRHKTWRQAESERKTYEISNQVMFPEECWDSVGMCLWDPGSIYKAIIINNKAVIL